MNDISPSEVLWVDLCDWLLKCGYRLRPRYRPGWKPSWGDTPGGSFYAEDGGMTSHGNIMDATRVSDGAFVALKLVDTDVHPDEAKISALVSSEPLTDDPRNHCVPTYETLDVPYQPHTIILVTPLLLRYDHVRFDTVGEVVDFIGQIFLCVQFLHDNGIAHRDCTGGNIMMDARPMFPEPWHPGKPKMKRDWSGHVKNYTRTERPPRYCLIDFGLSKQYDLSLGEPWEEAPIPGANLRPPEYHGWKEGRRTAHNPYATDVYYLGDLIRTDFFEGTQFHSRQLGLEFLEPLVNKMVSAEPGERPTMQAVVEEFDQIIAGLSAWKLRSRVVKANEFPGKGVYLGVLHWARRIKLIFTRVPAIPNS